jgi:DNA transformation protein and related proteins
MPASFSSSPAHDPMVAHLLDLLEPLGGVTARSMFGSFGFFREGAMLGLIWESAFYVRVDDDTRPNHQARRLAQFIYPAKNGKRMGMPYFQIPPEALDSAEEMTRWARPAARAAIVAKAAAPKLRSAAKAKPAATKKVAAARPVAARTVAKKKATPPAKKPRR